MEDSSIWPTRCPLGVSLNRHSVVRISACATMLILGWASPGTLWAQTANPVPTGDTAAPSGDVVAPLPLPLPGIQMRSLSVYGVYYSSFSPTTGAFPSAASNLPSDFGFGGSAQFDWTHFTDRSSFSLSYTSSYTGFARNSSLDALNHNVNLSTSRHLAPRWNLGFSTAASISTLEESLFAPTSLSNVASLPASFQDLAAGLLQSQFTTNPLLGSVLNSAPLTQSPLNTVLYGERMFNASVQSTLSYSYSPRLSLTFAVGGSRAQPLSDNQPLTTGNSSLALVKSTSGRASVALSYSLSPRTQISGTVASNRTISSLYDIYTTTSTVSVSHSLRRWILQARGGGGITVPAREMQSYQVPVKPFPSAGFSLTYKTLSHTFLGSYDRSVNAGYGVGAATSSTANATWRWRLPGHSWSIDTTFGYQQLQGGGVTNMSGWRSTTGFNQAVSSHLTFRLDYAYLNYSGGLEGSVYNNSQSAVRASMIWFPSANSLR